MKALLIVIAGILFQGSALFSQSIVPTWVYADSSNHYYGSIYYADKLNILQVRPYNPCAEQRMALYQHDCIANQQSYLYNAGWPDCTGWSNFYDDIYYSQKSITVSGKIDNRAASVDKYAVLHFHQNGHDTVVMSNNTFSAVAQLNDTEFVVLERDMANNQNILMRISDTGTVWSVSLSPNSYDVAVAPDLNRIIVASTNSFSSTDNMTIMQYLDLNGQVLHVDSASFLPTNEFTYFKAYSRQTGKQAK